MRLDGERRGEEEAFSHKPDQRRASCTSAKANSRLWFIRTGQCDGETQQEVCTSAGTNGAFSNERGHGADYRDSRELHYWYVKTINYISN